MKWFFKSLLVLGAPFFVNEALAEGSLQVTGVVPNESGFKVSFNKEFDPASVNIYKTPRQEENINSPPPAAIFLPDITFVDSTGKTIKGTILPAADNKSFSFIGYWPLSSPTVPGKQIPSGVMPDGNYTLTLRSADTGFHALGDTADLLDGDADGTSGGDFSTTVVWPPEGQTPPTYWLALPDFSRGPNQTVVTPNEDIYGGITVTINTCKDNAPNKEVFPFSIKIMYESSFLTVNTYEHGALNSNLQTSVIPLPDETAPDGRVLTTRLLTVARKSTVPESTFPNCYGATPAPCCSAPISLAYFRPMVPDSAAPYGATHRLALKDPKIKGVVRTTDFRLRAPLHYVRHLGDSTGYGPINVADAGVNLQVATGIYNGFAFAHLMNPLLIGDINNDGKVSSSDALLIYRKAIGQVVPNFPATDPYPTVSLNSAGPRYQGNIRMIKDVNSPVVRNQDVTTAVWVNRTRHFPIDNLGSPFCDVGVDFPGRYFTLLSGSIVVSYDKNALSISSAWPGYLLSQFALNGGGMSHNIDIQKDAQGQETGIAVFSFFSGGGNMIIDTNNVLANMPNNQWGADLFAINFKVKATAPAGPTLVNLNEGRYLNTGVYAKTELFDGFSPIGFPQPPTNNLDCFSGCGCVDLTLDIPN